MSQSEPVLTVAIPNHNRAEFLALAIQSVLEQTFPVPYEVLLVDDGSTDGSLSVASMFTDPHFRIIAKEHTNAPDTRNRCIAEARGEWIVWVDSDDVMLPDAISKLWQIVSMKPDTDVVYGDLIATDARLEPTGQVSYETWRGRNDELLQRLLTSNPIPNPGTMVRKAMYEKFGGYNTTFIRGHDYEFWSRIACDANFDHLTEPTYLWRFHENCLTPTVNTVDKKSRESEIRVVRQLHEKHNLKKLYPFLDWNREDALDLAWRMAARNPFLTLDPEAVEWCLSHVSEKSEAVNAMRVLHVGWGYYSPALNKSGLVVYNHRLVQMQTAFGLEAACFVAGDLKDASINGAFVTVRDIDGVRYFITGNRPAAYHDFEHPEREISNPEIEELFEKVLIDYQPQVVHFHNFVGLGLSLAEVANRSGIATVYTAHNFWLPCPRGNLITPDNNRCYGPGDGSQCASCALNQDVLPADLMNVYKQRLDSAKQIFNDAIDYFIGVSQRVANLYRSFGFRRSQYDSGIASQSAEELWNRYGNHRVKDTIPDDRLPRFGYFGTIQPIKGLHVFIEALLKLQQSGERIAADIFGLVTDPDYARILNESISRIDTNVIDLKIHGSYEPDQIGELLVQVDVAVIPSLCEDSAPQGVMEAVGAGVPVIGSSLGGIPELIRFGSDGWLFNPGDSTELATILQSLTIQPHLIHEKRLCMKPPKPFMEHVEDLMTIYRKVIETSESLPVKRVVPVVTPRKKKVLFFAWDRPECACARLRWWDPLNSLEGYELISGFQNFQVDSPAHFLPSVFEVEPDIVVLQRQFPVYFAHMSDPIRSRFEQWKQAGIPFHYDIDDDFFSVPEDHPDAAFFDKFKVIFERHLNWIDSISASTPELVERMRRFGKPVFLLPNQLNDKLWKCTPADHPDALPLRIGWMGTPTHEHDLRPFLPMLDRILRHFSGRVVMQFQGWIPPEWKNRQDVWWVDGLTFDYAEFVGIFNKYAPDIALAPLNDNPFNHAKSDIKYLEYSIVGAAGIYPDLPAYRRVIQDRHNGILVPWNDVNAWENAIIELIENSNLRNMIASNAKQIVDKSRTLSSQAGLWKELLDSLTEKRKSSRDCVHFSQVA